MEVSGSIVGASERGERMPGPLMSLHSHLTQLSVVIMPHCATTVATTEATLGKRLESSLPVSD